MVTELPATSVCRRSPWPPGRAARAAAHRHPGVGLRATADWRRRGGGPADRAGRAVGGGHRGLHGDWVPDHELARTGRHSSSSRHHPRAPPTDGAHVPSRGPRRGNLVPPRGRRPDSPHSGAGSRRTPPGGRRPRSGPGCCGPRARRCHPSPGRFCAGGPGGRRPRRTVTPPSPARPAGHRSGAWCRRPGRPRARSHWCDRGRDRPPPPPRRARSRPTPTAARRAPARATVARHPVRDRGT